MSRPKGRKIEINGEDIILSQTKGEKAFWNNIKNGMHKRDAYMKAHPNANPKWAHIYANKIINKDKFKIIKENLWEQYKDDAPVAYKIQKNLMEDERNDPELRNKIADKIQDRAGFSPVVKTAQLSLSKNLDNPLIDKSEEELKKIAEETHAELKEIKKQILSLSSPTKQEMYSPQEDPDIINIDDVIETESNEESYDEQ